MKSASFLLVAGLSAFGTQQCTLNAAVSAKPIRGEVIVCRTNAPWESQQVQEPCILPNPKDPARLVMFYSGVPATNRNLCFIGKAWALKSDPFTYVLSIEVGVSAGKRWRPVIAVSQHPDTAWVQTDVDALLQTKWDGLYRDDSMYHVATPALYPVEGRWYLYAQACPLPANGNYIDGRWDLWCIACDLQIPTLPGCESIYIPGP